MGGGGGWGDKRGQVTSYICGQRNGISSDRALNLTTSRIIDQQVENSAMGDTFIDSTSYKCHAEFGYFYHVQSSYQEKNQSRDEGLLVH